MSTKTVYFVVESTKTYKGLKAANIFRIENNMPKYLTQIKYRPASTMGVETEALAYIRPDLAGRYYGEVLRELDFEIILNNNYLELK